MAYLDRILEHLKEVINWPSTSAINFPVGSLKIAGENVGVATIADVTATATEINKLAGVTGGVASASKALVVGANKNLDVLAVLDLKLGAGAGTSVTATAAELNKLASAGAIVASGTQAIHAEDLKADYVKTDIDDAGTIDGTEVAVVLNLLAARCNAIVARLEAFKINASS